MRSADAVMISARASIRPSRPMERTVPGTDACHCFRQEAISLAPAASIPQMIKDLILRAATAEFDAEYELERLADETPAMLTPHLPDLLAAGVLYPAKLYRTAGDDMQRAIVTMIDDGTSELNALLLIFAHTRGPVAENAFRRWQEQPPPGADELFVSPADYMREGGWTLENGRVRELCGPTAYSLKPDPDKTVEPPAQGECPWCRAPLWTVLD